MPRGGRGKKTAIWSTVFRRATHAGPPPAEREALRWSLGESRETIVKLETELMACMDREKQQASEHAKAIDEYAAEIKALREKLSQASVEAVKASEASAKLSADSAVSALEATKLILARAESLKASREAVPDDAKKAASLDGI